MPSSNLRAIALKLMATLFPLVAFVAIVLALAPQSCHDEAPSSLLVEATWPRALKLDEPVELTVFVSDKESTSSSAASVTLYGWPNAPRGEPVSVQDKKGRVILARGRIDTGLGSLEIPPLANWNGFDRANLEQRSIPMILEVRSQRWFSHRSGVRYLRASLPFAQASTSPTLALTLDRPLYQPGQPILMRTVVVDADTGRPLGEEELHWQIHDPQGNLVFDHRASTSGVGVASAEYQLAPEGQQGDYTITVTAGNRQESQTISVLPFRLPRFRVDVSADRTIVGPGDEVQWRVEGQYIHGEPVAEARVKLEIEWAEWQRAGHIEMTESLDAEGILLKTWQAPGDLRPGTKVRLKAMVYTEAGRAEEGSATLSAGRAGPRVEILPAGQASFVIGRENQAIAIVTDGDGAPMAQASLTLYLPERSERLVELTTDPGGRATFAWTPSSGGAARIQARLPDVAMSTQHVDVSIRGPRSFLRPSSALARVSQPFKVLIDAHASPKILVVENGAHTLHTRVLPPSSAPYEVDLPLTDRARGLSTISLHDSNGAVDSLPIWVQQQGTNVVEVKPEAANYEPDTVAWVDLAFPVIDGTSDTSPVTFGLIGVDEALYALKERADVPFEILLRQAPETIAELTPLLEGFEDEDELGRQIRSARFFAGLSSATIPSDKAERPRTTDVTGHEQDRRAEKNQQHLFYLLIFCLYGFLLWAWQLTVRHSSKEAFRGMNVAMIVAIAFAAAVGWYILVDQFGMQLLTLAVPGGLLVTAVMLAYSSVGDDATPAFGWFATLAVIGAVFFALITVSERSRHVFTDLPDNLIIVLLIVVPALTLAGTFFAWTLILLARKRLEVAIVMSTMLGLLLFGIAILFIGAPVQSKFASASNEFVTSQDLGVVFNEVRFEESAAPAPRPTSSAPRRSVALPSILSAGRGGGGGEGAPEPGTFVDFMAEIEEEGGLADDTAIGAKGAAPQASGHVRSFFPETMVWMPEIASDEEGKARISFPVPDSITTWRLDAYAHTQDGRFGQGQAALRVTRPVFVDLDLPTHLIDGDRLEIPATLVNHADEAVTARLEATTTGSLRVAPLKETLFTVGPRSRQVITMLVEARGVGQGELTVSAFAGDAKLLDGERRKAHVAPHGRTLSKTLSGIINEGKRHDYDVPTEAIASTAAMEVSLYPGSLSDTLDGLDGMLRMPNGCFEQTSSINFPNILILQLLAQTPPSSWPGGSEAWKKAEEQAREFIHLGYQRILTFQDRSGGFALYPGQRPEIMLTAYGLRQLVELSKVHPVDERVIDNAARFLAERQGANGSWLADPHRRFGRDGGAALRTTALVSLGVLRATDAPTYGSSAHRALDYIATHLESDPSPHTLALAANALILGGRETEARQVTTRLAAMVQGEGDTARLTENGPTWMGGRGNFADIETTAMAAVAFLESGSHAELWSPTMNYLARSRASWGGWGSTQATVWVLMAMQKMRASPGRTEILVQYGEDPLPHVTGNERPGVLLVDSQVALMRTMRKNDIATGASVLSIEVTEPTATMYRATLEYAVPWTAPQASNPQALQMKLDLSTRDLTVHRTQRAKAALTNRTNRALDTLVIELPIAPGAFVSRDDFEDLVARRQIDYFEILPTHIRLYLLRIQPGQTITIDYAFVPMLRGAVTLPPLRAYEFYTPRPFFEIDGAALTIR